MLRRCLGLGSGLRGVWAGALGLALSACQGGEAHLPPRAQAVSLESVTVSSVAGLPSCDAEREGRVYYASDPEAGGYGFYVCQAGSWTRLELDVATGTTGPTGPSGETGAEGAPGAIGPTGATGAAGPAGATGLEGAPGEGGERGPEGPAGPTGARGSQTLVSVQAVPVDLAGPCPFGGYEVQVGVDANGNQALDAEEVTASDISCFSMAAKGPTGATGATGSAGVATRVDVSALGPGPVCPSGGVSLQRWRDTNGNGVREQGEEAVGDAVQVCNGASAVELGPEVWGDVTIHGELELLLLQGVQRIHGTLTIPTQAVPAVSLPDLVEVGSLQIQGRSDVLPGADLGLPDPSFTEVLHTVYLPSLTKISGAVIDVSGIGPGGGGGIAVMPASWDLGGRGARLQLRDLPITGSGGGSGPGGGNGGAIVTLSGVPVLSVSETTLLTSLVLGDLEEVAGSISITHNAALPNLPSFGKLTSVASVDISYNDALTSIGSASDPAFASLTTVAGDLKVSNLQLLDQLGASTQAARPFGQLRTVAGSLEFQSDTVLPAVPAFDLLESVGGLALVNDAALTALPTFQALSSVDGDLLLAEHFSLAAIEGFPVLTDVAGDLRIEANHVLDRLGSATAAELFPVLQHLGGDLSLYDNPALAQVRAFPAVASIDGTLLLHALPQLQAGPAFPLLTSVDTLEVRATGLTELGGFPSFVQADTALIVEDNVQLTSISAFSSPSFVAVDAQTGTLQVRNNPLLASCPTLFSKASSVRDFSGNTGQCVE